MFLINNLKSVFVFAGLFTLICGCQSKSQKQKPPRVADLKPAYSSYYSKGDFAGAVVLASLARETFHTNKQFSKEAEALLLMSDARIMLADYKGATKSLDTAINLLKAPANDSLKATYNILKGDVFTALLNAKSARASYQIASQLISDGHFNKEASTSRLNLCQVNLYNRLHNIKAADSLIKDETSTSALKKNNYFNTLLYYTRIRMVNENGSPDSALQLTRAFEKQIKVYYPSNNFLRELLFSAYSGSNVNAMNYENSTDYARKELTLAVKQKNPAELFSAYYDMSEACMYNQDLKQMILYTDSADQVRRSDFAERSLQASMVNSSYGKAFRETHDYAKSGDYMRKNIKLDSLLFGKDSEELAKDYAIIANIYYGLNDYNAMIYYMNKCLVIRQKIYKPDDVKIALTMDDIARCYDNMEKPALALPMQKKILDVYKKTYGPAHSYVAWAYDAEADSYDYLKDYKNALLFNNMAFAVFVPAVAKDPSVLGRTTAIPFDIYIPDYFASRVLIYYNYALNSTAKADKVALLKQGYEVANSADKYLQSYNAHFNSPENVASTYQRLYDYYKLFTDVSGELFELTGDIKYRTSVLNYAENKRGSFLRSNILSAKSIHFSGVPDSVIKREAAIKDELNSVGEQTVSAGRKESVTIKYEQFLHFLAASYPNYYRLKYLPYSLSETQVQHWLPDANTAFAEYMMGKTNIFLLLITKQKASLITLKKSDSLLSQVLALNNLLTKSDYKSYYASAYKIYKNLVKPMEGYIKKGSKVIISGDGELSTLSFEALVTTPAAPANGFNKNDFLFNNYNFTYTVSAFSLLNPFEKGAALSGNKAYFSAPGFDGVLKEKYQRYANKNHLVVDHSYLACLYQPFMLQLGDALARHWKITKEEGSYATESDFKAKAPSNNIIQIGSHAVLDDIDPLRSCLVFAKELTMQKGNDDGYLYSSEIYNQKLNADLIILTACETGGGKFKEGEGMMSLAYSFEYAGCKSAMMSLWPVDEKTSSVITKSFYKHLALGESTTDALYDAKKDFLKTADGTLVNPFYWSGLVMLGENKKITLDRQSSLKQYYWLTAVILLLGIGTFGFKLRQAKQAA